jgi:hypothetical protein
VHGGAAFLGKTFHKVHDFLETLLLGFSHGHTPLIKDCHSGDELVYKGKSLLYNPPFRLFR